MFLLIIISSFLLFSVILFSGIVISHFFKWDFNTERFKQVFFMGMLFYLAVQLILFLISFFFTIKYDQTYLFIYIWVREFFVIFSVVLSGFFYMLKKGMFRQDSYREFPFIFSYISGFFALSGLTKIVNSLFKFDSYILFIYPVICIVLVLFVSIIIIEASTRRGYISILIYSLLLPLSLLLTLAPWFYYLNYFLAAIGVALVSFFGAGVLFYALKKDYTRN